jgi:Xaa-Pro aminopeptidase
MQAPEIDMDKLRKERVARLQAEMKKLGLGGMYFTERPNVLYTVNLKVPGGSVFVPLEGDPILYVRPRDDGYCRLAYPNVRPTRRTSSVTSPGFAEKMKRWAQEVKETLAEFGCAGGKLGVDYTEAASLLALQAEGVDVVDGRLALVMARSVKTPQEIWCFQRLGKIYAEIMAETRKHIVPGTTERDLYGIIQYEALKREVDEVFQLNVCSGENMNPWRRWPTERAFRAGDFVGIDLHLIGPGGCWGDISRTYLCGDKPKEDQTALYKRTREYLRGVIGLFKPGERIDRLVDRIPPVPEKYQTLLQNYSVAHSDGMRPSEYPDVDWKRPMQIPLEENMVFSVESYFSEVGAIDTVKLEEMVLIGPKGAELLTEAEYDERLS